jgi:DNA invertase Pin-like site-specific DNA recombinase
MICTMNVTGYARVSTDEQARSGYGLDAQREAITAAVTGRGWTLTEIIVDDGYSARNLKRPGIARALEMLKRHQVGGLVVSKLDRLSRSLMDFTQVMDRAQREGWALVALDLGVDTSTPAGEMLANVLASFAQYERRIIGQRTREGLAEAKRQGVQLGNPRRRAARTTEATRRRIVRWRQAGRSYGAIATRLNEAAVPTAFGGLRWYASSVRAVVGRKA